MTTYGILIVDTSWANNDTVGIDKTTFTRHRSHLIKGAKALIYIREPIDAVVAEAEITSNVIEIESEQTDLPFDPVIPATLSLNPEIEELKAADEPQTRLNPYLEMAHDFRVPLKLVRLKGQVASIPLGRLQTILGSNFSVFDETWIPLSQAQYEQIAALW